MRRTPRARIALALGLLLAIAVAACGDDGDETARTTATAPPTTTAPPTATTDTRPRTLVPLGDEARVETVAEGLEIPWEIAFLPDGRALITERPGRVRVLERGGGLRDEPALEVDVAAEGEGGLLGLAVDPDFRSNRFVYLYRTTADGNRVDRYRLDGDRLVESGVVVEGIPAGPIHDGGRIRFGPDDALYITTGETGDGELAQDPSSLAGKILRVGPDGYRADAPVRPEVFSLGHRNPQGLDWDPDGGELVATEHGPSGGDGPRGFDEVNLVRQGRNHGWPEAFGDDHGGDFVAPIALYEEAIAPSGGSFVRRDGTAWTGDFLFGALVGEQIRRIRIENGRVTENEPLFEGELGRVRTVVEGPDGALYALTSNRDGRGSPRDGDDRVVRIVPPRGDRASD